MTASEWRDVIPRRGPWLAPPAAALGAYLAALVLIGWFFLYRDTGQIVDQLALLGAKSYIESGTSPAATVFHGVADVSAIVVGLTGTGFIAIVVALIVALMLWQRKWWHGVGAIALFAGANLTTQGIKAWWDRPDLGLYQTYGNSWPSGHTTVAAAAVFAVLLLTPARGRWAVSLVGGIFATLMAWGTVINGWHRPSDTVAAICVAAIWYVLVETIRRSVVQVPPEGKIRNRVATRIHDVLAGICAALGIGILAATILTLPDSPVEIIETAEQRLAFVGAFFGIAAVAIGTSRVLLTIGPCEDEPRN